MAKAGQVEIKARIVIEQPVPDVLHSLQAKDNRPLDPKRSPDGQPLAFDFPLRVGPGQKFFGEHVRPEGPQRRFVYVCIGQSAGDHDACWTRRMKIDIHDTDPVTLDRALSGEGVLEYHVNGTAADGTPACATVRPVVATIARR